MKSKKEPFILSIVVRKTIYLSNLSMIARSKGLKNCIMEVRINLKLNSKYKGASMKRLRVISIKNKKKSHHLN